MELDEHLTIKQVAEKVHVDRRTIHRWIQKGKLRAIRIPGRRGGEWRISLESLRELGLGMTNGK